MASTRWPRIVSTTESDASTPTSITHEEEQHQDGAGVDDDLHREQERRVEDGVQDGEADHHDGQQQRGVHGLADEQDAEGREHHDRREDPEGRSRSASSGAGAPPGELNSPR